jgi:hypothetical protein
VAFAIRAKKVDAFSWLPLEKTPIGKVERISPPIFLPAKSGRLSPGFTARYRQSS